MGTRVCWDGTWKTSLGVESSAMYACTVHLAQSMTRIVPGVGARNVCTGCVSADDSDPYSAVAQLDGSAEFVPWYRGSAVLFSWGSCNSTRYPSTFVSGRVTPGSPCLCGQKWYLFCW